MRHRIPGLATIPVLLLPLQGHEARAQCVPFVPIEATGTAGAEGERVGTSVDICASGAVVGSVSGASYLTLDQSGAWISTPVPWGKGVDQDDLFGVGVAIDHSTLVVGASRDDTYASDGGAVYVYDISGDAPMLEQQLGSLTPALRDWFGRVVAIDDGVIVVAAPGDDDAALDAGAVSVFVRQDGFWVHQQTLTAPDPSPMDAFGTSLAIHGDTLIVGAPGDDSSSANAGAAFVFRRTGSTWSLVQQLTASDASIFDSFGQSLACDGVKLAVGAWAADEGAPNAGAVYVYELAGGSWTSEQKLTSVQASTSDMFGASVAIEGDFVVVGAVQADGPEVDTGAAVVFRRSGAEWIEAASIPGEMTDAYMGAAVAISNGIVMLGSPFDASAGHDAGASSSYDLSRLVCPADLDLDCDTDVDDALTFLHGFDIEMSWADLAPPEQVIDFCDVIEFINRFTLGCP